jgi:hypothetical protein
VIVLALGMVSGFIWGNVMADAGATATRVAAWRLAHIEGFANGVLMLVIALSYVDSGVHDLVVFYGFLPGVIAIFFVLGALASSLRKAE